MSRNSEFCVVTSTLSQRVSSELQDHEPLVRTEAEVIT